MGDQEILATKNLDFPDGVYMNGLIKCQMIIVLANLINSSFQWTYLVE